MIKGIASVSIPATNPRYLGRWYEDHFGIGFGIGIRFCFSEIIEDEELQTVLSFHDENVNPEIVIGFHTGNVDNERLRLQPSISSNSVTIHEPFRITEIHDPENRTYELSEQTALDKSEFPLFKNVTGIGGVFLVAKDSAKVIQWFKEHFFLFADQPYHSFEWKEKETGKDASTVFSIFSSETKYLSPSKKKFMINFRVKDIEGLLADLKSSEVELPGEIQDYGYGKFAWAMDPEGNKIEFWQP